VGRRCFVAGAAGGVLLLSVVLVPASGPAAAARVAHAPAYGAIAVTNANGNAVEVFAPSASGNAAPVATISGASTELSRPSGVGFGSDGSLYVANYDSNSITVYRSGATGNVSPTATIIGADTQLDRPVGLAVSRTGGIWVASGGDRILEFAPGATGNVAPARTITGAATGISKTSGLALTPDGTGVWLSDQNDSGSAVEREFSTSADGNAPPIAEIGGAKTLLNVPYGVAAERDGTVVFDNASKPYAVLSFGRHSRGNRAPTRGIGGSKTGLDLPTLVGLDAKGNIWVPNFGTSVARNSLTRYPGGARGNTAPTRRIKGAKTHLNGAEGVAVFMREPSAPRSPKKHVHHKTLTLSWHAPTTTGGGVEGYEIRHAKHKSGTFHLIKTTTKTSYKKHHPKHGYYDVVAFNQAGDSTHSKRVHVT
jgi:hypothetical protein